MVYYLKKWYRPATCFRLNEPGFFHSHPGAHAVSFRCGARYGNDRQGKGPGIVLLRFFHILVRYAVIPMIDNLVEKDFSAPRNDPAQAELFGISCMDIKKRSPNHRLAVVLDLFKNRLIFPVQIHLPWHTSAAVFLRSVIISGRSSIFIRSPR